MTEERESAAPELIGKAGLLYEMLQSITANPSEAAQVITMVHCRLLIDYLDGNIDDELSRHIADVRFNMANIKPKVMQ